MDYSNGLAVSPDGSRVFVTGLSTRGQLEKPGEDGDMFTVAYSSS
jgi:sugar lactone lactonase YvrE